MTTPQPKRINDAQVQQIRLLYQDGLSQSKIAMRFGMKQTNVSKIVRGDTHRNAPGPINKVGRATGERHGLTKISTEEVGQMRNMRTELGTSYNDLSRIFNLSPTQCRLICMGVARVNG
jgi:DNA-binding transcriptional regulator YiaG